jgi:hypothetical protein
MRQTVRNLVKRGMIPEEDGWGGWLGRYQVGIKAAALEELGRSQRARGEGIELQGHSIDS